MSGNATLTITMHMKLGRRFFLAHQGLDGAGRKWDRGAVICFAVGTNSTGGEPSAVSLVTFRRARLLHRAWLQRAIRQRCHKEQRLW